MYLLLAWRLTEEKTASGGQSVHVCITCSISTAFLMMSLTVCADGLSTRCLNIRQAKSQCRP